MHKGTSEQTTEYKADLHIHTYFSDGLMSAEEVVRRAKQNGVNLLAVTDHDTMLGFPEAKIAAEAFGVKIVAGMEVSAYENGIKLHTLCYNPDTENADFKAFIKRLYEGSFKRAEDILYKLEKNGVKISMREALAGRERQNSPVHTMHIARAGANKGYAANAFTFYSKYLTAGGCGYSSVCRPSSYETVEIITAAGGFASLAHPGRVETTPQNLKSLINNLKACGLGGIEAVYSAHTAKETAYYKELAESLNLLVTGGSDTHIADGKKVIGTPEFHPSNALVSKLGID